MDSTAKGSAGTAIGAGVAAAVVGAVVWALIARLTGYEVGFFAIGVGALVGFAVGKFAPGSPSGPFPIVAGAIALVAVVLGNVAGFAAAVAKEAGDLGVDELSSTLTNFGSILTGSAIDGLGGVSVRDGYTEEFSPVLLLFIALAAAAAFSVCRGLLENRAHAGAPPAPSGQPYGAPTGQPYGAPAGEPVQDVPPTTGPDFTKPQQ